VYEYLNRLRVNGRDVELVRVVCDVNYTVDASLAACLNRDDVSDRVQRRGQRQTFNLVQRQSPDRVLLLVQHRLPLPEVEDLVLLEEDRAQLRTGNVTDDVPGVP